MDMGVRGNQRSATVEGWQRLNRVGFLAILVADLHATALCVKIWMVKLYPAACTRICVVSSWFCRRMPFLALATLVSQCFLRVL
jgi:hypothetical protein